jgi:hypothetical protein
LNGGGKFNFSTKHKIIIFQKSKNLFKMSNELPLQPSLKITSSAVYVGEPKQLVDLLAAEVAQAVIEVHRTKGGMPLFKCLLRCKTLFNGNLPVYFLSDFPNIPLELETSADGKQEVILRGLVPGTSSEAEVSGFIDDVRARRFLVHLDQAIAFWGEKMEDEVTKVYTDKSPKHVGKYATHGVLAMKVNSIPARPFDTAAFLETCKAKHDIPCFKISFGWIASEEDPRSDEHAWGFKFEMSIYAQHTESKKSRAPTEKKRKVEGEEKKEEVESA